MPIRRSTWSILVIVLLCLAAPATAGQAAAEARIKHVVLCWLHEPGNAEQARSVIDASMELAVIPELEGIVAGTAVPSDRAIVDDSFDVGLVMDFRDRAALETYLGHPEHVRRVDSVLRPLCARVLVYDIGW